MSEAVKRTIHWAIGTKNPAKLKCVELSAKQCFPNVDHVFTPFPVPSNISDQPLSDDECIQGAENRAKGALAAVPEATHGVGLEGGVSKIGDKWFECGWICVVERSTGRVGLGSSARFLMSRKLMTPILEEKKELAEVMDALSGQTDVRSGLGAMGVLTDGHLDRVEAYSHGMTFALAPFLSDPSVYWD
jgi:inosine/xanthosine triphosphatase